MFNRINLPTLLSKQLKKSDDTEKFDEQYARLLIAFRAEYTVADGWVILVEEKATTRDGEGFCLKNLVVTIGQRGRDGNMLPYSVVTTSTMGKREDAERAAIMEAIYRLGIFLHTDENESTKD